MLTSIDFFLLALMLILVLCKCSNLEFFKSSDDSVSKQNIIDDLTGMCAPKGKDNGEVCKYLHTLPTVSQSTGGFLKNMMSNVVASAQRAGKIVGNQANMVEQKAHNAIDSAITAVNKIPNSSLVSNSVGNIVAQAASLGHKVDSSLFSPIESAIHDVATNATVAAAKLKAAQAEATLAGDVNSIKNSAAAAAAHIAQSVQNVTPIADAVEVQNNIKNIASHVTDEAATVASNVGGALSNAASKIADSGVGHAAQAATHAVGNVANNIGSSIGHGFSSIGSFVSHF